MTSSVANEIMRTSSRPMMAIRWIRIFLALICSTILLPFGAFQAIIYQLAVEQLSISNMVPLIVTMAAVFLLVWNLNRSDILMAVALIGWTVGTIVLGAYFFGGPAPKLSSIGVWLLSTTWIFFVSWWPIIPTSMANLVRRPYWLLFLPLFILLFHVGNIRGDGLLYIEWRLRYKSPQTVIATAESADDNLASDESFPGFLGRNRDANFPGIDFDIDWSLNPPTCVWRQSVGNAWSGIAIARRIAVTQAQKDSSELVVAFDAGTGKSLWAVPNDSYFDGYGTGPGPRATPSIDEERVYSIGANGMMLCLDLISGKTIWKRNVLDDHKANRPEHGYVGSPLVVGDLVIVALPAENGPSLAAYRKTDGTPSWTAGKRAASYSSPTLVRLQDRNQIVLVDSGGLIAVDDQTGAELGQFRWGDGGNRCPQPVFTPGPKPAVILSSYECGGTTRFDLHFAESAPWSATEVWNSPVLKTKFTTPVLVGNLLFGIDRGILVCLDADSGKRHWKAGRYGEGQLAIVGKYLIVLGEEGEVALVEPSADGHRELGRIQALEGKTWNSFAVVDHHLYLRNSQEIVCYRLGERKVTNESGSPHNTP